MLAFALVLPAQKPGSAEELVIQRLGNRDAAAADGAVVDLIRGGTANAALLRKVLAASVDARVRERAERALAICSVDAPVENGVKIGLRADKQELKPGESAVFTATLCNVSDQPVAICLGISYSGNVLQNGLALEQVGSDGASAEHARFGRVSFCGTGAQALVELLPPWSSRQFTTTAEYRIEPKPDSRVDHQGPHLAANWVFLPLALDTGGKVKLRLQHDVDPASAGSMVPPEVKSDWKGTLTSNTVELTLRKTAGG
jgi:hypothetical protein